MNDILGCDCDGKYWAVSVYEDYMSGYIRKFLKIRAEDEIPIVIKRLSAMEYYKVAYSGITGDEWYYDRDRVELKNKVELLIKSKKLINKIKRYTLLYALLFLN